MQISTAYGQQKEGSTVLPRNKYTEIRSEKPADRDEAKRSEFQSCKFTTEAIVTEGFEVGTLRKVCTNAACPVHHPKPLRNDRDEETEQEKQRREHAIANTTGLRVLAAISAAVPVRLMKRDLLFIASQLSELMGDGRLETLAKQHGIKRSKHTEKIGKLFAGYLNRADEGMLSRIVVELTIVLMGARSNAPNILREAATVYKVDTEVIAQKVKAEFAAKEKAKKEPKPATRPPQRAQKAG